MYYIIFVLKELLAIAIKLYLVLKLQSFKKIAPHDNNHYYSSLPPTNSKIAEVYFKILLKGKYFLIYYNYISM